MRCADRGTCKTTTDGRSKLRKGGKELLIPTQALILRFRIELQETDPEAQDERLRRDEQFFAALAKLGAAIRSGLARSSIGTPHMWKLISLRLLLLSVADAVLSRRAGGAN